MVRYRTFQLSARLVADHRSSARLAVDQRELAKHALPVHRPPKLLPDEDFERAGFHNVQMIASLSLPEKNFLSSSRLPMNDTEQLVALFLRQFRQHEVGLEYGHDNVFLLWRETCSCPFLSDIDARRIRFLDAFGLLLFSAFWAALRVLECSFRGLQTWGICTRRAGNLYKARSRLYRSQILQVNIRWKALAEIYTMHSFAPLSNLKIFVKNC